MKYLYTDILVDVRIKEEGEEMIVLWLSEGSNGSQLCKVGNFRGQPGQTGDNRSFSCIPVCVLVTWSPTHLHLNRVVGVFSKNSPQVFCISITIFVGVQIIIETTSERFLSQELLQHVQQSGALQHDKRQYKLHLYIYMFGSAMVKITQLFL